jgi:hypothetical protein
MHLWKNKALYNLDFCLNAALNDNFGFDKGRNLAKKKRKLVLTHVVSISKIHSERALANASIRVLTSLSSL